MTLYNIHQYCDVKTCTILVYWMLKGKGTSKVVVINCATYYFFLNSFLCLIYFMFLFVSCFCRVLDVGGKPGLGSFSNLFIAETTQLRIVAIVD